MKLTCAKCNDVFQIPDGQGITHAVCPFCTHRNDTELVRSHTKKPPAPPPLSSIRPAPTPRHPLATPVWILAIAAILMIFAGIAITALNIAIAQIEAEEEEKSLREIAESIEIGKQHASSFTNQIHKLFNARNIPLPP